MIRTFLVSLTALGVLLGTPQAALATPESVLDIREEPFGLSDTHLFMLRSSSDNLGLYESLRSESFLVAIDLETGAEEHWLLDRMVRSSDYSDDGELLGYKVVRDAGLDPVNPFAVLSERSALPWSAMTQTGWYNIKAEFARAASGSWQASYPSGQVFEISDAALTQKLASVGTFMAENIADHPRLSTISTQQLFADRMVPLDTCAPVAVFNHFALNKPGTQLLVQMDCSDRDEVGVTSLIVRFAELPAKPTAE